MECKKRKSARLKYYDYSQNGYYFITICTHKRQQIFGEIKNGKTKLNDIGKIVDFTWNDLKNHNDINLHEYIIMPDHIHGIIEICNRGHRGRFVTVTNAVKHHGIPEIIRQFKTFSSKRINEFLRRDGLEPSPTENIWQRSYYDHIIRNEEDFLNAWKYINQNPIKQFYKENPF